MCQRRPQNSYYTVEDRRATQYSAPLMEPQFDSRSETVASSTVFVTRRAFLSMATMTTRDLGICRKEKTTRRRMARAPIRGYTRIRGQLALTRRCCTRALFAKRSTCGLSKLRDSAVGSYLKLTTKKGPEEASTTLIKIRVWKSGFGWWVQCLFGTCSGGRFLESVLGGSE